MSKLPSEIRKACMRLGVRSENLTKESVLECWKRQIIHVHPHQDGDVESAISFNVAKDILFRWLDENGLD